MKGRINVKKALKWLNHYMTFFLIVAFVITCCTMLFVTILSNTLNVTLTDENISLAAKITFLNVILLSLVFTVLDSVRRRYTVERPVKQIEQAAEKIIQGDFSVRIKPLGRFGADDTFNKIIDSFNKMAKELSGVETLRCDFVSNVSHEMKTPLSVMGNYATLLMQENLSEEKRMEYAVGVADGSKRLADMMTNILRLNRLESQKIYPNVQLYDLGEQLCSCLLQYENVWESKNIEIETDIEENVTVNADSELLALVWNNLFSNAFKFTDDGGKVTVKLCATQHHATVSVADTGCGMSEDVGKHIFEKFYQGDTSRSSQGNGLGLALVKKVVDILHGEIGVESLQNSGTTFTVRIGRGLYEKNSENT